MSLKSATLLVLSLTIQQNLLAEELSWSEIAFRTIQNSPALRVQKIEPKIKASNIQNEKSIFDPKLTGKIQNTQTDGDGTLRVTSPQTNQSSFESQEEQTNLELSLQQKLKYGTTVDLNGSIIRNNNDIESPDVTFNGKDDSNNVSLSLSQPILKGRGTNIQETRVRQADLALNISKYELAAYTETLIYNTLIRSLDYYFYTEQLKVIETAIQLEEKEQQDILLKIEAGVLPQTEKIAAEASLAQRQQSEILSKNAKEQARLDLIYSLSSQPNELWDYHITFPKFSIPSWAQVQTQENHITTAYTNRYDLKQAQLELQQMQLDVTYFKNGILPKLDFFTNLGYSDYDRRDAFNAVDTVGDGFQYQLGLQFEIPLLQRREKSELKQAHFRKSRSEAAIVNLKRLLERDIRKTHAEFQTFQKQFEAAQLNRKLRKQAFDVESDRRQQGLATGLQVERAHNEFLNSQIEEIQIKVNEFKTRLLLFYRDGSLLSRLNLKI